MNAVNLTTDAVLESLKRVIDPDLRKDIVSLGFVKNLQIDDGRVRFTIELTTPACPVKDLMKQQAEAAVSALPGVQAVDVSMTATVRSVTAPEHGRPPLPGVKNVIAVGAGKGGVGKTTVSVNLALALAQAGSRVGILDGDIYGPNVPMMLGLDAQLSSDGHHIIPAEKYGIQVVSIGFMTGDDAPVIWITSSSICRLGPAMSRSVSARRCPLPARSSSRRRRKCRWPTAVARSGCIRSSISRRSASSRT